jgi:hypothetical protein
MPGAGNVGGALVELCTEDLGAEKCERGVTPR